MPCITGYGELNLIHHKILSYVYEKKWSSQKFQAAFKQPEMVDLMRMMMGVPICLLNMPHRHN